MLISYRALTPNGGCLNHKITMHKNTNMTDDCFTMFDDELGLLLSNYIKEDWYMFESEKWRNKYHKLRNDAVKLINEYNAEVEAEAFATSE